jgi:serine/threonine protein kinase
MEDLTGKQFGPYRITAPLGEGGMAAVYKAFQPGVDRFVALKVLPQHYAKDPQFVERFEREAKVLAKLQHPHILPVHDFGEADGGYTYIVMPFVESGDLAELMTQRRLSLPEISRIIGQVGDALDYAHSQGIVHRDVKPSNILVDGRGNCLLTDFGLAKIVSGYANKLTGSGFVVGTPEYMAPEQGMSEATDGRCDIYALGVILYELVTGRVPFSAETPVAIILKHVSDPLPPPRQINPNIPEVVEQVILKAMAKSPADRYATPGDMIEALQAAIQIITPTQQTGAVTPAEDTDDGKTRVLDSGSIRRIQPKSPAPAPKPLPQVAAKEQPQPSSSVMFWGVLSFLLIVVIGVALLGLWRFSRPGPALNAPPPSNQDQPSQPAQPPANQSPQSPQAPSGQFPAPPPEAIEACRGAAVGAACTANTRRGVVTGTCQTPPGQQQLACIPAGGPPPGP